MNAKACRIVVLAQCFALLACSPRDYDQCRQEAAKNPTEHGVKVAVSACYQQFEAPRLKAKAEADAARSVKIAEKWGQLDGLTSLAEVKAEIGQPDESIPYKCMPLEGAKPPESCTLHMWKDARTPEACALTPVAQSLGLTARYPDGYCRWRLQTTPDGKIWARIAEPG